MKKKKTQVPNDPRQRRLLLDIARSFNSGPCLDMMNEMDTKHGKTVTELQMALGWNQSFTSQVLGTLKAARLALCERQGHHVIYYLNYHVLRSTGQYLNAVY